MNESTKRRYCDHICRDHPRKGDVVFCNRLWHGDDDAPHECVNGHRWAVVRRTPESDILLEQPTPHGEGIPVEERLIALIRERTKLGIEKYGEPLTTHNGRDAMLDSLHESVDQNQYLMQVVLEQTDEIAQLSDQIGRLGDYLLSLGGPDRDESACEMAVRLLKDARSDDII